MNLTHYNLCNKIERTPIMKKFLKIICCVVLALTFVVGTPLVELGTGFNVSSSAAYAATKISKPKISLKYVNNYSDIKISWKKCSGAQKYWVYRAEKGKKYRRIKVTSSTSFTDKSVSYNRKYSYKVCAIGKNGKKSSFSNIKSGLIECDDLTYDDCFGVPDFGYWFYCEPYDIYRNDFGVNYMYDLEDILANDISLTDAADLYSIWLDLYGFDLVDEDYSYEFDSYDYLYIRNYDSMGLAVSLSKDGITIFITELD